MRSQGRHKRSKSNKDPDGDIYMNVQVGEDLHPDSYSRSRSSVENYRTASSSARAPYNSDRERAPRSHRDEDWHHATYEHDRYAYGDPYSRGDRLDDYDDDRCDKSGSWRADPSRYTSSSHDWSHRYDHVGSSSYSDPAMWTVPPPAYESGRSSYSGHWQERESRDLPVDDWEPAGIRNDRVHERRHEWRQEDRRDKNGQQKYQSDSGWSTRRREREWARDVPIQNDYPIDDRQERSWEPAASWKSSNRNNQQQQQRGQQAQNLQRQNGKSKRSQNQNKQRREWRQGDDGDLNK